MKNRKRILRVLSTSDIYTKRLKNRALLSGGTTTDRSVAIDRIRNSSLGLGRDILKTVTPTNLATFSEEFDNSIWVKTSATVVSNAVANPVNGLVTADKLVESVSGTSSHDVGQTITGTIGQTVNFSAYIKANERTTATLIIIDGGITKIDINLSLGTITGGTGLGSAITNEGNGWYRSSFYRVLTTNNYTCYVQMTNGAYSGDGTSSIYVFGAQATLGQTVQPYQQTPISNGASFVYNPSSYGESKNYVVYPQLNNLLQRSEELDNGYWAKGFCSITTNAINDPNGNLTADKIVESASSGDHRILVGPFNDAGAYNYSVYAKAGERNLVVVKMYNGLLEGRANFNLSTGAITNITSGTTANIEVLPNGYYRCSVSRTDMTSGFFVTTQILQTDVSGGGIYTGDGVSGLYVWGEQLTKGTDLKPYQRTTDGIIDFNFTRATTATVTNKDGSIGDSCYNLIQYSEDYTNAIWTKFNTTIAANSTTNYLGQNIASKLVENTASGFHEVHQSFTLNTSAVYTESAFLKYAGRQFVNLQIGNTKAAVFDLQNGLVINLIGSGTTATITPYSDGWYYCTVSSVPDTNTAYVVLQLNSSTAFYSGDGVSGVYVCGVQVTQGTTPKDYLKTTNRLAVPRIDYSLDLTKPSLLIERQSTNLFLSSENFASSDWSVLDNSVKIPNTNLNAFGVNKSMYLSDNATSGTHDFYQFVSIVSGFHTSSFYIKKADHSWVQITSSFSPDIWVNFNFDTGLFGNFGTYSSMTYSAKQLTNGWFKVMVTANLSTATAPPFLIASTNNTNSSTRLPVYSGTGAKYVDICAAQVEAGNSATTYIPTTTATVTRNGETSYVYLWNNGLLNKDNFTLYVEGTLLDINSTTANIFLGDSLSPNYTDGWYQGFKAVTVVNGADIITGVSLSVGTKFKTIITGNGNTAKFYRNGTLIATHTRPAFDYRYLNINHAGDTYTIDKIELYKETLSDAQCVTKTT